MSDNKKEDEKKTSETDKELSELLDSALADFSKEEPKKETKDEEKVDEAVAPEWSEDFVKQFAEQFEGNIGALLGGTEGGANAEEVQLGFQRMAEAAQMALQNPGIDNPNTQDFASAISQTIQGLNQGTENLQNPFSENDIMGMFSNLAGQGDQNAFVPFMQGMMQSLLSKEVLYPSLKDIIEKYPAWLRENDATLSPADKERYLKQQDLMERVCAELEAESDSDSQEVKKTRFDKVLNLMQTLQDYGHPPTDIVAEAGPPMMPSFDQVGNPEQCCLM